MRPKRKIYTLAALNATGYASDVSGATWALTSTTGPDDGTAHKVTITGDAATDHSAKTAILIGTDADGKSQTETIAALPNGATTVTSVKYYKTLTSVVPSATIGADTMDIGWAAACVTPTYPIDAYRFNTASLSVTVGGTITYTAKQTNTDPFANGGVSPLWVDLITSGSASTPGSESVPANAKQSSTALRVEVASHTSGILTLDIAQGR